MIFRIIIIVVSLLIATIEVHATDKQMAASLKEAAIKQSNVEYYFKNASEYLPEDSKYPFAIYKIIQNRQIKFNLDENRSLLLNPNSININIRF